MYQMLSKPGVEFMHQVLSTVYVPGVEQGLGIRCEVHLMYQILGKVFSMVNVILLSAVYLPGVESVYVPGVNTVLGV